MNLNFIKLKVNIIIILIGKWLLNLNDMDKAIKIF